MADYGLQVFDPNGDEFFDSTEFGWLWIDSFMVGATSSGSKTYNDLPDGITLYAYGVPTLTTGGGHNLSVSGKTVTYTYFTGNALFVNVNSPTVINIFAR